ncbi:50S ribosomal protein L3 [Patescibacteria group bacterium]|nr:50S ribosomal protein L3 [Patescibacteria group bacterium]
MNLTGLIARKNGQTQAFLEDGTRIPVSILATSGNIITQVKTSEKEGYDSVQLGFDVKKRPSKTFLGHSKKAGIEKTPRFLREIRLEDFSELTPGTKINVLEVLGPGDIVNVTGISKGKGFAGVVKRHGFHGGPKTHGQSDRHRAPGSIGQGTTPGRVYKGKKMAGHMGVDTVTVKNLVVMDVADDGMVLIKGLVPGPKNGILMIKKVGEKKKFIPLIKQQGDIQEEQAKEAKEETQLEIAEEVKSEVVEKVVEVSENQNESSEVLSKQASEDQLVDTKAENTEKQTKTEEGKTDTAEDKVEVSVEPQKETEETRETEEPEKEKEDK